jgi:sulfoxide reductase heme-binding subunit YedZ
MAVRRAVPAPLLRWLRLVAFVVALIPLLLLIHGYWTETLSVNPLDDITDTTGTWTLRFIVITLSITPLRKLSGFNQLAVFRRMMGLYAFFYGTLHLFTYLYFDKFFEWEEILLDIPQRRFILVGFTAWTLMLALAVTTPKRVARWMGGVKWKRLHRAVYVVAICGVVHYYWLVKFDTVRPITYGVIVVALLLFRAIDWGIRRKRARAASAT